MKENRDITWVNLSVRDKEEGFARREVGHQQFPTEGPSVA